MKMKLTIWVVLLLSMTRISLAADRLVSLLSDIDREGELRPVLQDACARDGDDMIRFVDRSDPELSIRLRSPLVIPAHCKGSVTIEGLAEKEVILDAYWIMLEGKGKLPGESCLFYIYSDGHTIRNLSVINYEAGAGLCIFGRNNRIENNHFGATKRGREERNYYGIVVSDVFQRQNSEMNGSGNIIQGNEIQNSLTDAVYISGDRAQVMDNDIHGNGRGGVTLNDSHSTIISGNTIQANGGCARVPLSSQNVACMSAWAIDGAGILIENGSSDNLIGGDDFDQDHNLIQYNANGGILIRGNESHRNTITHNVISKNYPRYSLGIDLGDDGVTPNDWDDLLEGPNGLLDYLFHLQSFPLVDSPTGQKRYWTWGFAPVGDRVEIYVASDEDLDRDLNNGGGDEYEQDVTIADKEVIVTDVARRFEPNSWLTTLTQDQDGNTSEFSQNTPVGPDQDMDGIPNQFEISGDDSSSPNLSDTDGDGLPDAIEDKNRNGFWDEDKKETSASMADSDEDGLNDWVETHGDGVYDKAIDTDPLNPDTDGDGILDGMEDKNHNGVWEVYLKETNPLMKDSDGDGVGDETDVCPWLFSLVQDPQMCIQ